MNQIEMNRPLRVLLQTARLTRNLTQREAAQVAGIDPSWWKKLESGRRTQTQAGTAAAMAYAVGVDPADLDKIGWPDIADRLRILLTNDALPTLSLEDAEDHLARTPGTSAGEREYLILALRELRRQRQTGIGTHRREPFEEEFNRSERT